MLVDLSDIVLRPSDFPDLAALCREDPSFPKNHDAWIVLIELAEREARQQNVFPPPLLLEPALFQAWCDLVRVAPCMDALRAYVIVQRGRVAPLDACRQ